MESARRSDVPPGNQARRKSAVRAGVRPAVAISSGHYSSRGGAGEAIRETVEHIQATEPNRCFILTADGRRVDNLNVAEPASRSSRLRRRFIRDIQRYTPLPVQRWLTGTFDVYHYIGTSLRPRVPYRRLILSAHDLCGERWSDETRYPHWAGSVLQRAARIVTVSEFSKTELCSQYGLRPGKVNVVYNGCDHTRFHPHSDPSDLAYIHAAIGADSRPFLLCAGGATERKNVARLLRAYGQFLSVSGEACRLVVTGVEPGSPAGTRYTAVSRELGLRNEVVLPGYLPDDAMPALYRGAEAVVVPSLYEGFGLPVLQGMACGTPVVASNSSSVPEIAGDGALLVDATSINSLAAGLAAILTDDALRTRLRVMGLQRAREFTWERCARETIAIYEDVFERASTT